MTYRSEFENLYKDTNDLTRKGNGDYVDWNLQLTWNCFEKAYTLGRASVLDNLCEGLPYFAITTDANRRPNHPEDNTMIIQAKNLDQAIEVFSNKRGYMTIKGSAISCRKISYVFQPGVKK